MVAACQGVAARKEDLKVWGDFEEAPQIEHGKGSGIITALPLGKNLPPKVTRSPKSRCRSHPPK